MRARAYCEVLLAMAAVSVAAAGQVSKPGTGTVTGHVICQDTQKPARFASVMLYSVPTTISPAPKRDPVDPKAQQEALKTQMDTMTAVSFVQTQTGIDGSFVAADVPPGDYFIMATVPGYVLPRNLIQAAYDAGENLTKGVPGIPTVHVSADRSADGEISVSRGAAIEGRVLWDDGGAVNNAVVQAELAGTDHKNLPPQFGVMGFSGGSNNLMGLTDDRGQYRISGLVPGNYTVKATLQTASHLAMQRGRVNMNGMQSSSPLVIYAPGAFHKADAKPVTLTAAEEHGDLDIVYNLSGTHAVSGKVTSAEDHHGINQAQVLLTDANDKTFRRSVGVDDDGNFNVTFVPQGTYAMEVSGAADTTVKPGEGGLMITENKITQSYEKAERQVIVMDNDMIGQNVELKPLKKSKNAADSDDNGDDDNGRTHIVVGTGH